jgi:uncharacterized membrane protein
VITDPLDLPATPTRVRAAAAAAELSPRARERALEIATATPDARAWQAFLSRALASVGTAFVVAGVVCFFAYNWERIGRFGKLGLIEVGIAAAALVGWRKLPRLSGQIALTAAAMLVGPLLGVYGQAYQTGADPYGLFLTWVVLIAPWVIAARFTTLWVLAVLVLDLGLTLWWFEASRASWVPEFESPALVVALVHGAAVAAWEWQARRRTPWLTEKWAPHDLAAVAFGALFVAAARFIVDLDTRHGFVFVHRPLAAALVALLVAIGVAIWYYRSVRADRFMVTVAGATGLALLAVVVGRVLIADLDLEAFGFFVVALFVVAEVVVGLRWLREAAPPPPPREASL